MSNIESKVIEPKPTKQIDLSKIGGVLHLPYNPAGQMSTQALELQKIDVQASFCNYYDSKFQYPNNIPSPIKEVPKNQRHHKMLQFAKSCAFKYNIFHFHGGHTFTGTEYSDLKFLKSLNKKMVMSYWGSEIRRLSIAKKNNPYAVAKHKDEKLLISRIKRVSKYIDVAIVPDHELLEYIYGYFKKIYIIRHTVDNHLLTPIYPQREKNKPLIVHAPSDPYLKGTKFISSAIQNLKKTVEFDYVIIEDMANEQALDWYKKADIIIDQLHIGTYATLAIEGMFLGKPVITYIRDDLKSKYPAYLPIVSASPDTLEQVLLKLIQDPQKRHDIGVKGREYAEKYHKINNIAKQLLTVYKDL